MNFKHLNLIKFLAISTFLQTTHIVYGITNEEFLKNNTPVYVSTETIEANKADPNSPKFTLKIEGANDQVIHTLPSSIKELNNKYKQSFANPDAALEGYKNLKSAALTSGSLQVLADNKPFGEPIKTIGVARIITQRSKDSPYEVSIKVDDRGEPMQFSTVSISDVKMQKEWNFSQQDKAFLKENYPVYVSTKGEKAPNDPNSPEFTIKIEGAQSTPISEKIPNLTNGLAAYKEKLPANVENAQATLQGYRQSSWPFKLASGTLQIFENGKAIPNGSIPNLGPTAVPSIKYGPYTITVTNEYHGQPIDFNYVTITKVEKTPEAKEEQKEFLIYATQAPQVITASGQPDESDKTKFKFKIQPITPKDDAPKEIHDEIFQGYYSPPNFTITPSPLKFIRIDPAGAQHEVPDISISTVQEGQTIDVPPYYKITLKYSEPETFETGYLLWKKQFPYRSLTIDKVEIDKTKKQQVEASTNLQTRADDLKFAIKIEKIALKNLETSPEDTIINDKKNKLNNQLDQLMQEVDAASQEKIPEEGNKKLTTSEQTLTKLKKEIANLPFLQKKISEINQEEKKLEGIKAKDSEKEKEELRQKLSKLEERIKNESEIDSDKLRTDLINLKDSIENLLEKDKKILSMDYWVQERPSFEVNNPIYALLSFLMPQQGSSQNNPIVAANNSYWKLENTDPNKVNATLSLSYAMKAGTTAVSIKDPISIDFTQLGEQKLDRIEDNATKTAFEVTVTISEQQEKENKTEKTVRIAKISNVAVIPNPKDAQEFNPLNLATPAAWYFMQSRSPQNNLVLYFNDPFAVPDAFIPKKALLAPVKTSNNKADLNFEISDLKEPFNPNWGGFGIKYQIKNLDLLNLNDQTFDFQNPDNPNVKYQVTLKISPPIEPSTIGLENTKNPVHIIQVVNLQRIEKAPEPIEEKVKYYLLQDSVKSDVTNSYFTDVLFVAPASPHTITLNNKQYFEIPDTNSPAQFDLQFNKMTDEGVLSKLSDTKSEIALTPGTTKFLEDNLGNKFQLKINRSEKVEEPDAKTRVTSYFTEIEKVALPPIDQIIDSRLTKDDVTINEIYTEKKVVVYTSTKIWEAQPFKDLEYKPTIELQSYPLEQLPTGIQREIKEGDENFEFYDIITNEDAKSGVRLLIKLAQNLPGFLSAKLETATFIPGTMPQIELEDEFGNTFICTIETLTQKRNNISLFKNGIFNNANQFLEKPASNEIDVWLLKINSIKVQEGPDARNKIYNELNYDKLRQQKIEQDQAERNYLLTNAPVYFNLKPVGIKAVHPKIEALTGKVEFALKLNGKSDRDISDEILKRQNISQTKDGSTLTTYANTETNQLNGLGTVGLTATVDGKEVQLPQEIIIPFMKTGESKPITVKIPGQPLDYEVKVTYTYNSEGWFGRGKVLDYLVKISSVDYEDKTKKVLLQQILAEENAKKDLEEKAEFIINYAPVYIQPIEKTIDELKFSLNIKDNQLKPTLMPDEEFNGAKFAGFINADGKLASGELVVTSSNGQKDILEEMQKEIIQKSGDKTYTIYIGDKPYLLTLGFTHIPGKTTNPIGLEEPTTIPAKYIIELKDIKINQAQLLLDEETKQKEQQEREAKSAKDKFLAENIPVYIATKPLESTGNNKTSFQLGLAKSIERQYSSTEDDKAQAADTTLAFAGYAKKSDLGLLEDQKIIIEHDTTKIDEIPVLKETGSYTLPMSIKGPNNKTLIYNTDVEFSRNFAGFTRWDTKEIKYLVIKLKDPKFNPEATEFEENKTITKGKLNDNYPVYITKADKKAEGLEFSLGLSGSKPQAAGIFETRDTSAFAGFANKTSGKIDDDRKLVLLSKSIPEIPLTGIIPKTTQEFFVDVNVNGTITPMSVKIKLDPNPEQTGYYHLTLENIDLTEAEKTRRAELVALKKFINDNAAVYIDTSEIEAYPYQPTNKTAFALKLDGPQTELKPGFDAQEAGINFSGYYNKNQNTFEPDHKLNVYFNGSEISNSTITALLQNKDLIVPITPIAGDALFNGDSYQLIVASKFNKSNIKDKPDTYIIKLKEAVNLTKTKQEFPEAITDQAKFLKANIPVYISPSPKSATDGTEFKIDLIGNTVAPIYPPILVKNNQNEDFKGYADKTTGIIYKGELSILMNNQPVKLKEPITKLQSSGTREIRIPKTDYIDTPYILVLEFNKEADSISVKINAIKTVDEKAIDNEIKTAKKQIEITATKLISTLEKIKEVLNNVASNIPALIQEKNTHNLEIQTIEQQIANAKQAIDITQDNLALESAKIKIHALINKVNDLVTQYDNELLSRITNEMSDQVNNISIVNDTIATKKTNLIDKFNALKTFITNINNDIENTKEKVDLDKLSINLKKANSDLNTLNTELNQFEQFALEGLNNIITNLNNKADDLITKTKNEVFVKLSTITDQSLETDKTTLQTNAEQLIQDIQDIKLSINTPQVTLVTLKENEEKLGKAQTQLTGYINSVNELITQNTNRIGAKTSLKDRTQNLINSIFTNLEEPLTKAQPINPKSQAAETKLTNDIADLKKPLLTISTDINKRGFDVEKTKLDLTDYEDKILALKQTVDQFVIDNAKFNEDDRIAQEHKELQLQEVKNNITFLTNNIPIYITTSMYKPNQISFRLALTKKATINPLLKAIITADNTQATLAGYANNNSLITDGGLAIFMDNIPHNLPDALGKNISKQIPFTGSDNIPYIATINFTYKELPEIIAQTKNLDTLLKSQTPPLTIPSYAYIINLESVVINQSIVDQQKAQAELATKAQALQTSIDTDLIQKKTTDLTTEYNPQTPTKSTALDAAITALKANLGTFITKVLPAITDKTSLTNATTQFNEYQTAFNDLTTQLNTLINSEHLAEGIHNTTIANLDKRADALIAKVKTDILAKLPGITDSALQTNKTTLQQNAEQLIKDIQGMKLSINTPRVAQPIINQIKDELDKAETQLTNYIDTLNHLITQNSDNIKASLSIKTKVQSLANSIFTNLEEPLTKTQPINPKSLAAETNLTKAIADLKQPLITISTDLNKADFDIKKAQQDLIGYEDKILALKKTVDQFVIDNAKFNEDDRIAQEQKELQLQEVKDNITFLTNNVPVYITTNIYKPDQISFRLALTKAITINPLLKATITANNTQATFAGYANNNGLITDGTLAIFMDSIPHNLPEALGKNTSKQIPFTGSDNISYIATVNVTYKETPEIIAQTKNLDTLLKSQTPPLTIPSYAYIINLESVVVNQSIVDQQKAQAELATRAQALQTSIDIDLIQKKATDLKTEYNPQTPTKSTALDAAISRLKTNLGTFITKDLPAIADNAGLTNATDQFNGYQTTFNDLTTQLNTLIDTEKLALEEHNNSITNLNQEADALLVQIQTNLIAKIPANVDQTLTTAKAAFQNDAEQLVKDIQGMKLSLNAPRIAQKILTQIKDELGKAETRLTTLIQALANLTTKNTEAKDSIATRAAKLLKSIETELSIPKDFKPTDFSFATQQADLQKEIDQAVKQWGTAITQIQTNLYTSTFDFSDATKTLDKAEKIVDELKLSIETLINDNHNAKLKEEQRETESELKKKFQEWQNKFDALKQEAKNLTDLEFTEIKHDIDEEISDAEDKLTPATFKEPETQKDYNRIQKDITRNLATQAKNRQEKLKRQEAQEEELKSLQDEPAIYVDTKPFSFNNHTFTIDLEGQHLDRKSILKAKQASLTFEGYANAQGFILPKGYLAIFIDDIVKGVNENKLPQNGSITAEVEDKEGNPYIVTLSVTYSKDRTLLNDTEFPISNDDLPSIYTVSISDVANDEVKINEKLKAEELAKEKARKEAEERQRTSTSDTEFVKQHPLIYISQSTHAIGHTTIRLSLLGNTERLKKILIPQIDNYKLSGYATQNGTLYNGDIVVLINNQVGSIVVSENSSIGQGEKQVSVTIGDTIYTMKIKSELKSVSTLSPGTVTQAYFIEILSGSIQAKEKPTIKAEKPEKSKLQLHREKVGRYH